MKYTEAQMQGVINEWKTSGLSKKAFCRERKVVYQTFHYWYKRIEKLPTSGFAEVSLSSIDQVSGCQIIFPSGARMILQGEPSATWLRDLLR